LLFAIGCRCPSWLSFICNLAELAKGMIMDIVDTLMPFDIDALIADIMKFLGLGRIVDAMKSILPDLSIFTRWLDDLLSFIKKFTDEITGALEKIVGRLLPFVEDVT
jgi:hypothetical protein